MISTANQIFSEKHAEQFAEQFGDATLRQVLNSFNVAHLPGKEGNIGYVTVKAKEEKAVAIYVPGLSEGIGAKVAFGAALAEKGITTLVPDQNRKTTKGFWNNGANATEKQACGLLTIMRHSGLAYSQEVNVIPHSYGALVFQSMVKLADRYGLDCFKGGRFAFMAPSSSGPQEPVWALGKRFLIEQANEASAEGAYIDVDKTQLLHGLRNMFRNPRLAIKEIKELHEGRVDYNEIIELTKGTAAVFASKDDLLFTHDVLKDVMTSAVQHAHYPLQSYAVPIGYRLRIPPVGPPRVGIDSTKAHHNDDQTNPRRVAGAIADFLLTNAA